MSPGSVAWLRATFAALAAAWPASVRVEALLEQTGVEPSARASALRDLVRSCDFGHLELRTDPLHALSKAGLRPVVSPLTRLDASRGRRVTNQLHRAVTLSPEVAGVAALLDGTRDLSAVCKELEGAADQAADPAERAKRVAAALRLLEDAALVLA